MFGKKRSTFDKTLDAVPVGSAAALTLALAGVCVAGTVSALRAGKAEGRQADRSAAARDHISAPHAVA